MAIVKQRVHKYNGSSYDTIHYETSADVVLYGDTTVAAALDSNISSITGKADAVHAHGSLTSDGKVGTTASRAIYTTTGGAITAGSLAVTDPTASGTETSFIATISESSIGKITATKASLPTASTTTAGITTVGASGGAAAYSHTHDISNITGLGSISDLSYATVNSTSVTVASLGGTEIKFGIFYMTNASSLDNNIYGKDNGGGILLPGQTVALSGGTYSSKSVGISSDGSSASATNASLVVFYI